MSHFVVRVYDTDSREFVGWLGWLFGRQGTHVVDNPRRAIRSKTVQEALGLRNQFCFIGGTVAVRPTVRKFPSVGREIPTT